MQGDQKIYTPIIKNTMDKNECHEGDMMLARIYMKIQDYEPVFDADKAIKSGTMFPCLVRGYYGGDNHE